MQSPIPVSAIVAPLLPPLLQTPTGPALNTTALPDPPPTAETVNVGSLTRRSCKGAKEIVCPALATTMLYDFMLDALAPSVAVTAKLNVPTALGVPLMVAPLSANPVGKIPEEMVKL